MVVQLHPGLRCTAVHFTERFNEQVLTLSEPQRTARRESRQEWLIMKIKFSTRQNKTFDVEVPVIPRVGDVIVVSDMGELYPDGVDYGASEWIVENVTWYVVGDERTNHLEGFVVGIRNEEEEE